MKKFATPSSKGDDTENVFASAMTPSLIEFISSDRFVMVEKSNAVLFEIDNSIPRELRSFSTEGPIVAVLPAGKEGRFALLEQNGQCTLINFWPAF